MAAYVVVGLEWHDEQAFEAYRADVVGVVERFGGRFLASTEAPEVIEGEWRPKRVVVIEFASAEAARDWHSSDAYRPLNALRERGATSDLLIVDGLE